MSDIIPLEFVGIPEEVIHELRQGAFAKDAMAAIEAEKNQRRLPGIVGEHHPVNDLGQPTLAIDPIVYQAWLRKEGRGFWNDKANHRWLARNFPETKVRVIPNSNRVGWLPPHPRYSKSYGEDFGRNAAK